MRPWLELIAGGPGSGVAVAGASRRPTQRERLSRLVDGARPGRCGPTRLRLARMLDVAAGQEETLRVLLQRTSTGVGISGADLRVVCDQIVAGDVDPTHTARLRGPRTDDVEAPLRLASLLVLVCACLLGACKNDARSTEAPVPEVASARITRWAPARGEKELCPATEIRPPREATHPQELLCAVVARAWSVVEENLSARAVVNRDASGRPVRAELFFFRLADISRSGKPAPTLTYWQVNFPSKADTVGLSVTVDSVTGATTLFADHRYGAPYHDLLHPHVPHNVARLRTGRAGDPKDFVR